MIASLQDGCGPFCVELAGPPSKFMVKLMFNVNLKNYFAFFGSQWFLSAHRPVVSLATKLKGC